MSGPLSTQAEALVSKIKDFEASKDNLSRAERLQLVQSLEKLTLQLKNPKDAIFDHLTNVRFSSSSLRVYIYIDSLCDKRIGLFSCQLASPVGVGGATEYSYGRKYFSNRSG